MDKNVDVHQVFADYFEDDIIKSLAFQCSKSLEEGQICINLNEFLESLDVKLTKEELLQNKWVGMAQSEHVAFVVHQNQVYLHRYFTYETEVLDLIQAKISSEDITTKQTELLESKEAFLNLFSSEFLETDWQLVASLNAYMHNFSLITGGPGTGKTTTIAKLLAMVFYHHPRAKIALVAPTGKAAARMKESLLDSKEQLNLPTDIKQSFDAIHSSTIHRLLAYKRETHYFKHNQENPISYDWIIVDESSMIGVSLFSKFLQAIPEHCQMVLLGDRNQLSSVDAGSVFGDICRSVEDKMNLFLPSNVQFFESFNQSFSEELSSSDLNSSANLLEEHVVELRKNYRFSRNSIIGQLSAEILGGNIKPSTLEALQGNDFELIPSFQMKDLEPYFDNYKAYIQSETPKEALQLFKQFRILCPSHLGTMGVDDINQSVEHYLRSKGLISYSKYSLFYEHQPIMIRVNDYHLHLFNGDVGIVRKDKEGKLKVYFESEDGGLRAINPSILNTYETAFAMSIHKSQGSEFEQLVMVIPEYTNLNLLNKELIYTGVTRAKQKVSVFASESILMQACSKTLKSATGIANRIQSDI